MSGPPDDLTPPSVPHAPEFDAPPEDPAGDLRYDAPVSRPATIRIDSGTPWYQGVGAAVVGVVVVVVLAAVVLWRTSGPAPAENVEALAVAPPAPVVEPGPVAVAPLVEEQFAELEPLTSVVTTRPQFVPESAQVIEIDGREAAGTVSRPDGAWMKVTLAPGTYTFRVTAGADTELHLNDVFTELTFNDDTDGLNPVITERLIGGDYYLWLHIHDRAPETETPFTLTIEGGD